MDYIKIILVGLLARLPVIIAIVASLVVILALPKRPLWGLFLAGLCLMLALELIGSGFNAMTLFLRSHGWGYKNIGVFMQFAMIAMSVGGSAVWVMVLIAFMAKNPSPVPGKR